MKNKLHIVIPVSIYDTNYNWGIFFHAELTSLYNAGFDIHLHIFGNSDHIHTNISGLCTKISEYKINAGHKAVSLNIPFFAASRHNESLLNNLKQDDYPVLFYGTESASVILNDRLEKKRVIIRCPYSPSIKQKEGIHLTKNIPEKIFRFYEHSLYKGYEKRIARSAMLMPVTLEDSDGYQKKFHYESRHVPMLIPEQKVSSQKGKGNYCLFFADFADREPEKCAEWLLENVFNIITLPLVIAGKNVSKKLMNAAQANGHTCIIADPLEKELTDLISKSQVIIMPVFSNTGIKPEIYQSIIKGRHCIYYGPLTDCQIVLQCCHIAHNKNELNKLVQELFDRSFEEADINLRNKLINCPQTRSRIQQFAEVLEG